MSVQKELQAAIRPAPTLWVAGSVAAALAFCW